MTPSPRPSPGWRASDRWPTAPLVVIAVGFAVLAIPAGIEGPPIVPIGPGHALSAVDALGVLPLVAGALWLELGLWRRRAALARWSATRPGAGAVVWFGAGLGVGLLVASMFSRFFWWWAIGVALLAGAVGAMTVVARRQTGVDGHDAPANTGPTERGTHHV